MCQRSGVSVLQTSAHFLECTFFCVAACMYERCKSGISVIFSDMSHTNSISFLTRTGFIWVPLRVHSFFQRVPLINWDGTINEILLVCYVPPFSSSNTPPDGRVDTGESQQATPHSSECGCPWTCIRIVLFRLPALKGTCLTGHLHVFNQSENKIILWWAALSAVHISTELNLGV